MTTGAVEDEEAIRAAVARWESSWSAGDMEEAATTLFSEDADFVNVWGSHWHGRSQIASEHAERHRKQLKGSTFTSRDVSVHYLRTDVALVHISWVIRGDRNLDNSPRQPRQGLFTWVMLKDEAGHWWVRAAHNVHVASAP